MNKVKSLVAVVIGFAVIVSSLVVAQLSLAAVHSAGTNIVSNGTVYMITDDGQRRPYTSAGAFLSYGFNSWVTVAQASPDDMALPEGSFIPPRDGKIVCSDRGSDKGTCYLITNSKRAAFVSAEVFQGLGFSFSKALYGDVSFLGSDSNITNSGEQHRSGVLINKNGTVYLITSGSLMGIPSMDILSTWGYSLADVVMANNADTSLNQSSVISARQGAQLSPNANSMGEDIIIRSYLDTHPSLPSVEVSNQQDAALVLSLAQQILSAETIHQVYPYLSSRTLELMQKAPNFKVSLETPSSTQLADASTTYSKVSIYEGSQSALYYITERQNYSGYSQSHGIVFVKENGTWKFDLIGSMKYEIRQHELRNPSGTSVEGYGQSNITIEELDYTTDPRAHDSSTKLLVLVKNNGQTTIQQFYLDVEVNTVETYSNIEYYELRAGQSVLLEVPISAYWKIPVGNKGAGLYRTDVYLNLAPSGLDIDEEDNAFYFETNFR